MLSECMHSPNNTFAAKVLIKKDNEKWKNLCWKMIKMRLLNCGIIEDKAQEKALGR